MAFINTNSGDGDFTVYVKYNAKAGRWYTRKDEPNAEEYEVQNLTAVFDMDNIKTGWFLFAPGAAPVKNYEPDLKTSIASPGEGFKHGFEIMVFSPNNLGGVREFASTASVVKEAMNDLHTDWEANRAANPGKLPVVKCVGVQAVVGKHGTNYRPQLEIVNWADRPAELSGAATPAAKASPPAAAAPPPPAPATVGAGDTEF